MSTELNTIPPAIVTREAFRMGVLALEEEMRKLDPVPTVTIHHFSEGLYARELHIPKGTLLTGKIHKHEHLNIISQGDISVLTEGGVKRIKAPFTLVSPAGVKRVGYTHEDTVWTTIHATDERDLEKIEEHFIAKSFDEFDEITATQLSELMGG